MTTVEQHQARVRALLAPLADRVSPGALGEAGAVLLAPVIAPIDLPPFDNSQMDGYAVRSTEIVVGEPVTVAPAIAAGAGIESLPPGTVAPIMTGAPVPTGADAIIPVERAVPDRFPAPPSVSFDVAPEPGAFVRRRGSDVRVGDELLAAGTVMGPAQWGVVAAVGITEVAARGAVRVLVISTGDELAASGSPLAPGQIYDANGMSLAVALTEAGARVTHVAVVSDDPARLRRVLDQHAADADLIVTSGGVSMGAFEVVRDVFEHAGVEFGGVAMQPGGPQGLGTAWGTPVIAFPGNPVSVLVSFELFLRPLLAGPRRTITAPLAAAVDSPGAKHQVRRGRIVDGTVELVGGPGSHLLTSYAQSTHLVHLPLGVDRLDAGDRVECWDITAQEPR